MKFECSISLSVIIRLSDFLMDYIDEIRATRRIYLTNTDNLQIIFKLDVFLISRRVRASARDY